MRSPSLDGAFVFARGAPLTEDLLVALHRLWGGHARTVRGEPMPEEAVQLHARMLMRHPHALSVVLVPPMSAADAGRAPPLGLQLAGDATMAYDAGLGVERLTLELPVLQAAPLALATLWAGRLDASTPRGAARFLDAARRVQGALEAPFAFGASVAELAEPELVDPRQRAWGIAYYGAQMANGLPLDKLDGLAEVERDEAGGAWVRLDPMPFVDDPDKETRRRDVERALGLRERFGGGA